MKRIDVPVGSKFHSLTVIQIAPERAKDGKVRIECKCDCGAVTVVDSWELRNFRVQSCGCARHISHSVIHSESLNRQMTPEYKAYCKAKSRCENINDKSYLRYGARGIEFHFTSVVDFLEAVGRRTSTEHSLERIDNDGHYEKGNVRWATKKEQARNRRSNIQVTFRGITQSLIQWTESLNLNWIRTYKRLLRGWCVNCAFEHQSKHCIHRNANMA